MAATTIVSPASPRAPRSARVVLSDLDKLLRCSSLRHLKSQALAERFGRGYVLRDRLDLFHAPASAKKAECWLIVRSVAEDSSTVRAVGTVEEWESYRTPAGAEAAWGRRSLHQHLYDDLNVPALVRGMPEFP